MTRARYNVHSIAAVVLAFLAGGCGSEVVTPSADTGAGGAAGATTTATSGGFGGGGGEAGCGECPASRTCFAGECVPMIGTLILSLAETSSIDLDGKEIRGVEASLCGYDTSAGWPEGPGQTGACVVVPGDAFAKEPPPEGGTGGVLIETANVDTISLAAPDAGTACRREAIDQTGPLLSGTHVRFEGTGGNTFPKVEADVPIPDALELDAGPLERGSPFPIGWTGSGAPPLFLLVATTGSADDPVILCLVEDDGEVVVDGALTAALVDAPGPAIVYAARSETVVPSNPAGPFEVRAAVHRTDLLTVDYVP